jgi:hypothetical protein
MIFVADAYIAYDGVFGCVVEGPVGGVDLSGKCIFSVSRGREGVEIDGEMVVAFV